MNLFFNVNINDYYNLINNSSCCDEIKRLLIEFVEIELSEPTYKNKLTTSKFKYNYLIGLKYLIKLSNGLSISKVTWSNFCITLNNIYYDESVNVPWAHRIFREFYKYIILNTYAQLSEIEILRNCIHYLDTPERYRITHDKDIHPNIYNNVYLNFGVDTIPSRLYLYTIPAQGKNDEDYSMLINLNTDNPLIKELLIDFIESHPKKRVKNNNMGGIPSQLIFGVFIYYFERSLYVVNDTIRRHENKYSLKEQPLINFNKISDFNIKTFKKQFRFYNKLDDIFPITPTQKKDYGVYRYRLIDILKSFYIFLTNYIYDKKLDHNLFAGSDIDKPVLMLSSFNSIYMQGYYFIRDVRMQECPKRNRISIIITDHSDRVSAFKQNLRSFDFTKVKNPVLKEHLIDYVMNSKGSLSNRNSNYYYLVDFLNFKSSWDKDHVNIIYLQKKDLISEDFMFSYRLHIMDQYESDSTRDGAVYAVKGFLKYHKNKLFVGDFVFKYLTSFSCDSNGGEPIPTSDFNAIITEFRNLKNESIRNELCFIVFYICSTSKIRLGEVLKLRRNCVVSTDEHSGTGRIKLYSKTSDRNIIEEVIPITCIHMLNRALELTEFISKNSTTNHKDYFFIMESRKNKGKYSKYNALFLGSYYNDLFLKVQEKANLQTKYSPYQVRATRKNMIYEEASKAGYTDFEINEMLGGTMQVNLRHYIKKHNNELYVEIFTGVIISNVDLNGKVILDNIDSSNAVGNGIGSCEFESCKNEPLIHSLDSDIYKCLTCNYFRTCVSKIDIFKDEIIQTKEELSNCDNEEYKRFLESKLKLLGAYYKKLIDLVSEGDENH